MRKRRVPNKHRSLEPRPAIPLPKETFEDTALMAHHERERMHWIDDAYEEWVRNGGLKNLPGLGKPLKIPEGDVLESLLKNANVPPPWIMLRKEIQSQMAEAQRRMTRNPADPEIDRLLEEINGKIGQLNLQAPSLTLHRPKVNRDNLDEQIRRWQ